MHCICIYTYIYIYPLISRPSKMTRFARTSSLNPASQPTTRNAPKNDTTIASSKGNKIERYS